MASSAPFTFIKFNPDGTMTKSIRWTHTTTWTPSTNDIFYSSDNKTILSAQGVITDFSCWVTSPDDTIFLFGKVGTEQIGDLVSKSIKLNDGTELAFGVESNSYTLHPPYHDSYPYLLSI